MTAVGPCLFALLAVVPLCLGDGAGRAFPVAGKNYAIEQFQQINRNIDWDTTNYLVDLSGNWANCGRVGQTGLENYDGVTPDGLSIVAVVDNVVGNNADVNSANGYIREVVDRWARTGSYNSQIRRAERFGCSIRPGCSGYAVIGCLFSPGSFGGLGEQEGRQDAVAFTPEQYFLAETITNNQWDRSYFLENLSGFETECGMAEPGRDHDFAHAIEQASFRGMTVVGLFGSADNLYGTEPAIEEILNGLKEIPSAAHVGCSLIPDCLVGRGDQGHRMVVVVSCLYEEP